MTKRASFTDRQAALAAVVADDKHCAGCGKEFPKHLDHITGRTSVILGKNTTVHVCQSARYSRGVPLDGCVEKARKALALCPGCDELGYVPGAICQACRTKLDRERSATAAGALKWYGVSGFDLVPYIDHDTHQDFGRLFAAMLPGLEARVYQGQPHWGDGERGGLLDFGTKNLHSDGHADYWVELTPAQAAAVELFGRNLRKVLLAERIEGRKEGRALLVALGDGELTVEQFNEQDKKLTTEE